MGAKKKAQPEVSPLAKIRGLARVMREDHIAQIRLDAAGNPTDMILAPSAFMLDEKRRQEAELLERRKKKSKDGLPVEPDNPLREEMNKNKPREMIDGVAVDEDDEDLYSHTGEPADPFTARN